MPFPDEAYLDPVYATKQGGAGTPAHRVQAEMSCGQKFMEASMLWASSQRTDGTPSNFCECKMEWNNCGGSILSKTTHPGGCVEELDKQTGDLIDRAQWLCTVSVLLGS